MWPTTVNHQLPICALHSFIIQSTDFKIKFRTPIHRHATRYASGLSYHFEISFSFLRHHFISLIWNYGNIKRLKKHFIYSVPLLRHHSFCLRMRSVRFAMRFVLAVYSTTDCRPHPIDLYSGVCSAPSPNEIPVDIGTVSSFRHIKVLYQVYQKANK